MIYRRIQKSFLLGFLLCASSSHAAELTIQITDPPKAGRAAVLLFDSANTFGDLRDPIRTEFFDATRPHTLTNLVEGEVALLVYLDENENGFIDRNFIGIPKEPLGFANEYSPKGPPSYQRAAITLSDTTESTLEIPLSRPLGEFGRIGVGAGLLFRSSPYRDYNGNVYQFIPAISYTGNRLQIFGPGARLSLVGNNRLRLALNASYRMGVYKEEDSSYLTGMGDRDSTLLLGPSVIAELPAGINLSLAYNHDVLNRIGGGETGVSLSKGFQVGPFRVSPHFSLNHLSRKLTQHDYGVSAAQATPTRPLYQPEESLSYEGGAGLFWEISEDWLFFTNLSVEALDSEARNSPLVDASIVVKGFGAITYVF